MKFIYEQIAFEKQVFIDDTSEVTIDNKNESRLYIRILSN